MAIYVPFNEARTKAEYEKEKADRAAAEKAKEKERDARRYNDNGPSPGDKNKSLFDDFKRFYASSVSTIDEDLARQDKGLKPFSDKDKKVVEDKFNKKYRKQGKSSRGIYEAVKMI